MRSNARAPRLRAFFGKAIQMRAFADRRQALEWAGVEGSDGN
jgi:hypothetical protein